ncbi:hypothetical protein LCGC14_1051060 [marine sediment metagenome]|uniref:Uncharacterized protein n=1 Tax=marine sediment metagenome TaxID=412755 RepID=A0A0F9MNS0_9ZZZZ
MYKDFSRRSLIEQFPHTTKIKLYPDNRAFNWCISELKLDFKKDFDVRASNIGPETDFFFKTIEDFIAFKLRWQ